MKALNITRTDSGKRIAEGPKLLIIAELLKRAHMNRNNLRLERYHAALEEFCKNYMPSGSGIDTGTTIDLDRSTTTRIVLRCEFHHMSEHGSYDGWTSHTIVITPEFGGDFDMVVRGRNRNGISDYLYDTYRHDLQNNCTSALPDID